MSDSPHLCFYVRYACKENSTTFEITRYAFTSTSFVVYAFAAPFGGHYFPGIFAVISSATVSFSGHAQRV